MKTLVSILVIFISINANAQYGGATLKIKEAHGRNIIITINNRKYQQSGSVLTVGNIPLGNNKIKVYEYRPNQWGYANANLIFKGRINVRPNYIYRCTVEEYRGMSLQEYCCTTPNGGYSQQNNGDYNQNNNGNYNEHDNDWDDHHWGNNNENNNHNNNGNYNNGQYNNGNNNGHYNNGNNNNGQYNNGNNNNGQYNNGNNNNGQYNNGNNNNGQYNNGNNNGYNNGNNNSNNNGYSNVNTMSDQSFKTLKQTIENNNFDSAKQSILKSQLQNNWISCNQLKDLVDMFSFESSRMDAAKYGATRVVDKQNLLSLNDLFSYEKSKTEFANYIATLK